MIIVPCDYQNYRAPPLKALEAFLVKNHGADEAKAIASRVRKMWKVTDPANVPANMLELFRKSNKGRTRASLDGIKMDAIDSITKTYGIEYLGQTKEGHEVHYANAGETYAPTLVFIGSRMEIARWGDVLERPGFRSYDRFSGLS